MRPAIIIPDQCVQGFLSQTPDLDARKLRKQYAALFRQNNKNERKINMLLKNANNIEALIAAVAKCSGDVILRSIDGREEFNLKSTLSQYIAIGKLVEDYGDRYELFCMNRKDEPYMLQFFHELINEKGAEA